jgi:hypothetical protein
MNQSKLKLKSLLVIGLFAISNIGNGESPTNGWTDQEMAEKLTNQTHHWGQKGEKAIHNGWGEYSSINIRLAERALSNLSFLRGKTIEINITQNKNDIFFSILNDKNIQTQKAVSIPGAGLFYRPPVKNGQPDNIEYWGLQAELMLFLIARSFPDGPDKITLKTVKNIQGEKAEIRFMQGFMQLNNKWNAKVEIEPINKGNFKFVINSNIFSGPAMVSWSSNKGISYLADTESLELWQCCWSGWQNTTADGNIVTNYRIGSLSDLKTFGDIRKRLSNSRH